MGVIKNNTVDLTPYATCRQPHVWTMAEVINARPLVARAEGDPELPDPGTAVINIGNVANRELPESGEITTTDQQVATLIFGGLYSALKAVIPTKGDIYEDYPGLGVNSSQLSRKSGNLGELRITLAESSFNYFLLSGGAVLKDRTEFNWQQVEKSLLVHPYISKDIDRAKITEEIKLWKNGESILRAQYKYKAADKTEQTLYGKSLAVAEKMLKGIESYVIYAPVILRIREYQGKPIDTTKCGFLATLTGLPTEIGAYKFLKTADNLSEQDNDLWVRREEWTGGDEIDADLYTESGGWNAVAAP